VRLACLPIQDLTKPSEEWTDGERMTDKDRVWTAISRKRAIRAFADRPLEPAHLERILHAGRRAGSSKNSQRWAFVVCRDRAHLRELSVMFDLGQAAENMMLAAWELGIGSVPATVYDHDLVQRLLGYPADHHCEFLLSFGYPADPSDLTRPPKPGGRASLDEIVHEERW
jgi:nitroreductase